jgi:hypothetical protein
MKLFLILIATMAWTDAVMADTKKVVGKLGLVKGEVLLNQKTIKSGTPVTEGSVVEVKEGQATLLLGKGSVIHLASNSKMLVNEYGVSATGSEKGSLELKFGRTRALILNQTGDQKDIRIKARAATMGVRGTQIFMDVPAKADAPIVMATLEGKASVDLPGSAAPRMINQGEGISTSGAAPSGSSGGSSGGASGGTSGGSTASSNSSGNGTANNSTTNSSSAAASNSANSASNSGTQSLAPAAMEQVQTQIQSDGMAPAAPIQTLQQASAAAGQPPPPPANTGGFLSDRANPILNPIPPTAASNDTVYQTNLLTPIFYPSSTGGAP